MADVDPRVAELDGRVVEGDTPRSFDFNPERDENRISAGYCGRVFGLADLVRLDRSDVCTDPRDQRTATLGLHDGLAIGRVTTVLYLHEEQP